MAKLRPKAQKEFAKEVVRRLHEHGYTAYWAGGCVRDSLLGLTPKDYDVATDARPEEIRRVFRDRRTLAIGASFGVITVVGPKAAGQVDVATFRSDAAYSDGRHPDSVTFSTPEEDAKRRDFTVNGMFYDPIERQVMDFVGGQRDLKNKLLRAIGEPRARFEEDKLRMLRAARFAAAYDLRIHPETFKAIADMAQQIGVVSPERIAQEMRLMLIHPSRARAVELLRETGLLEWLLPEVLRLVGVPLAAASQSDERDAWEHTLLVLELLHEPSFPLALAALLHETHLVCGSRCEGTSGGEHGKRREARREAATRVVRDVGRRWRLAKKETQRAAWLVKHLDDAAGAPTKSWPEVQRLLISPEIDELLALYAAEVEATDTSRETLNWLREKRSQPAEILNPPPLIDGNDLIGLGIPAGKEIRRLLWAVRDAQLEGRVKTKPDALVLAKELWSSEA